MTKQPKKKAAIPRHDKAPVEAALVLAREAGWLANYPGGHAWGTIYCPYGHRQCRMSVWSTPRVPEDHGREIRKKVTACPGSDGNND
jgi:hypothetical protein